MDYWKMYNLFNTPKRNVVMYYIINQENFDLKIKKLNEYKDMMPLIIFLNYFHMLYQWIKWRSDLDISMLKKGTDGF